MAQFVKEWREERSGLRAKILQSREERMRLKLETKQAEKIKVSERFPEKSIYYIDRYTL